ncbi:bnr asp-box repeat domain protein [Zalerion maritima]|uniref:Bnr asp-box repeat domain protein n=1 Tax=Zalerion maritima TaxID=339359 RepID=A0AAD5RRU2_9PEZI|nr:bnr asp-box repeat domain protein [Zalerion maritima]
MFLKTCILSLNALSGLASALVTPRGGGSGRHGSGYGNGGGSTTKLTTFEQNMIFDPPDNYTDPQVLYPRTVQLHDGRLLATWENYSPEPPLVWFPIYESMDHGVTWTEISKITDQVNGWGLRYQPFLYEMDQDMGPYKKGTILLAGNSIPTDLSETQIDLYASVDKGRTWEFVAHIAAGGAAIPTNDQTPVWEPFIMRYKDTMIIYYADQRDPDHGQELSHQESTDLINWSDRILDVSEPTYTDRPGMPFVALLPTGQYMYVYEWGGTTVFENYGFPLYYRIADDPRHFINATAHLINAGDSYPISSPNVVWSPVGGKDGTILVSSSSKPLYFNRCGADPTICSWEAMDPPEDAAYTRNIRLLEDDPNYLLIMGAGVLPPSTTNNVTVSVIKVSDVLTAES